MMNPSYIKKYIPIITLTLFKPILLEGVNDAAIWWPLYSVVHMSFLNAEDIFCILLCFATFWIIKKYSRWSIRESASYQWNFINFLFFIRLAL